MNMRTLASILRRQIRWILAAAVAGAVLAGAGSKLLIGSTYESGFQMYVSSYTSYSRVDTSTNGAAGGLAAAHTLAGEYTVILQNDLVLSEVSERLVRQGYAATASQIRKALKVSSVKDTAMLDITVTTDDPNLSKAICDGLADIAPGKLKEITQMGSITVMAPAKKGVKVGPHAIANAALGFVIGAAVVCIVAILRYLTDTTVSGEQEIRRRLNLTVLGEIPGIRPGKKGGAAYAGKEW